MRSLSAAASHLFREPHFWYGTALYLAKISIFSRNSRERVAVWVAPIQKTKAMLFGVAGWLKNTMFVLTIYLEAFLQWPILPKASKTKFSNLATSTSAYPDAAWLGDGQKVDVSSFGLSEKDRLDLLSMVAHSERFTGYQTHWRLVFANVFWKQLLADVVNDVCVSTLA